MSRRRMMTLWYDDDGGELCDVDVSPQFATESWLLRADVTQDAIGHLGEMLDAYREQLMASFALEMAGRDGVKH